MDEERYTIRDYKKSDYAKCARLVSDAWNFDQIFQPPGLASVAKRLYTMSSVVNSNYFKVVETNGEVIGFIFGLNEKATAPRKFLIVRFGLGILLRILLLRGVKYSEKKKLLNAINVHNVNRLELVKPGRSEITLFVIDADHQGVGIGNRLLSDFISHCKDTGVESVIVETNTHGASSFYEGLGFKLIGYFDSPLHRYAAWDGQAGMYKYIC